MHRRFYRVLFALASAALLLAGCGMSVAANHSNQPGSQPTTTAQTASASTTPPAPVHQPAKAPTVPGAWIKVEPSTVHPGQQVTVKGYIPPSQTDTNSKTGRKPSSFVNLCFGGCADGLHESPGPVTWQKGSPGYFTTTLHVPAAPWLGAQGPVPLAPGTYRVGVQCVGIALKGCGLLPAEASTVVTLAQVTSPPPCTPKDCGALHVAPESAAPGKEISLHGWAPLTETVGTPMGYAVVLMRGSHLQPVSAKQGRGLPSTMAIIGQVSQSWDGQVTGSMRLPMTTGNLGVLDPGTYTLALQAWTQGDKGKAASATMFALAPTTLHITSPLTWAALKLGKPGSTTYSSMIYGGGVVHASGDAKDLALCYGNTLLSSTNSGNAWRSVPLSGAAAASNGHTFVIASKPNCQGVTLAPGYLESFFVSFGATKKGVPMPPVYVVGYVTTNDGASWHAVPKPSSSVHFAGFESTQIGVLALFTPTPEAMGQRTPPPFSVEASTDGGRTWHKASLACPSVGPCVAFGPAPWQIGGMGIGYPQPIEVSLDGGKTFSQPTWPRQVILNMGASEIVGFSPKKALLLTPGQYPLSETTDGGLVWTPVALPQIGDVQNGIATPRDLQMLPSGTLIAKNDNTQSWIELPPGANSWCTLSSIPKDAMAATVAGKRFWYVHAGGKSPVPQSVPLSALTCH